VLAVSFIGVYAVNNNAFDLFLMALFGLIGYVMRRLEFPLAPVILGLVLGDIMETNLVRLMTIADGDWKSLIFDVRNGNLNPITITLYILALISLFAPLIMSNLKRFKSAAVEGDAEL